MLVLDEAIGWIGNIAVFAVDNGYLLVDWPLGWKRMFIPGGEC